MTALLKNDSKTHTHTSLNLIEFLIYQILLSNFLSTGAWILRNSCPNIGFRTRKHYFKVAKKIHTCQKHGQLSKLESQASTSSYKESSSSSSATSQSGGGGDTEYLLSWTEFGQDKHCSDKEVVSILKSLASIKHPYIYPIEHVQANENGCLVIVKFHREGSLKDLICGSQPLNTFSTKYGTTKGRNQLALKDIAKYSRQILEAIKFLHSKGLPHGWLQLKS